MDQNQPSVKSAAKFGLSVIGQMEVLREDLVMKLIISLLLVGFCATMVHAQANPDPGVSRPLVCKKGGDVGPAGTCVPYDPNNPEHRKLLGIMNGTPQPSLSALPVQPPPPPDPITLPEFHGFQGSISYRGTQLGVCVQITG